MNRFILTAFPTLCLLIVCSISFADTFSKAEISRLAKIFQAATDIKDPVFADVDKDGTFDMLNFTSKGFVEYYRNTGTNDEPKFELVTRKFDNYEVNSLFGTGLPFPTFLADADGDGDEDLFAITSKPSAAGSGVQIVENQFEVTQGMLITIILVLGIIALLIYIL